MWERNTYCVLEGKSMEEPHVRSTNTWSVPKVMRMIFFCTAQKGQERKVVVEAGGGGTQVYSLTFLS